MLEQIPNIGASLAADLRLIGVHEPAQLRGCDAFGLYCDLCCASGQRQDPCVLDTFMAATDFMNGAEARPWWAYTARRKQTFGQVPDAETRMSPARPPEGANSLSEGRRAAPRAHPMSGSG
ncbi:helix-hairpin-helix domain-containing protein [Rivibacter subsaxonicus]|uniref:helix-hairpin-helix domain-containing protein n=1 Tax=Rivibacter subsaxonicus TaxID=457575 RepID=UPI001F5F7EDB|nr:helix-hairpin-helix domain-containing protein [Rivibacter subsaxonicus]